MLPPRTVLDEAHHEAIALVSVDHNGGDVVLLQFDEGLEAALTADEVVLLRIGPGARCHGDRALQADARDVLHHRLEGAPISDAGVEDPNPVGRDQGYLLLARWLQVVGHHATSAILAREASA